MKIRFILIFLIVFIVEARAGIPRPVNQSRIAEIAAMIPDRPQSISVSYKDRAFWNNYRNDAKTISLFAKLPEMLAKGQPPFVDSIYLEYSKTGKREAGDRMIESRGEYLFHLVFAECIENKGKYVPEIEAAIVSLCKQTPWTLSAHDKDLKTYTGEEMYVDLVVATFSFSLAESLVMLDDKISPQIRQLAIDAIEKRLFSPIRKCFETGNLFNWFTYTNNWNSVCLAGMVGAANAIVEDSRERAYYIAIAEQYHTYGIDGFEDDGYCSEGVGYYSYGFRSLITLRELVCRSTQGKIDFFAHPKLNLIAQYANKIHIMNNVYPLYSDARPDARVDAFIRNYCERAMGDRSVSEKIIFPSFNNFSLNLVAAFPHQAWHLSQQTANLKQTDVLRSFFPLSGIYVGRPLSSGKANLAVSAKGGNNGENHNHNDVGSYVVVLGNETLSGDQGCAITYTRDWFSDRAYDLYKSKGSYGHPVPLINGKGQRTGKDAGAISVKQLFTKEKDVYEINFISAYDIPGLKKVNRIFEYNRRNNTFSVEDIIESDEVFSYECPITTRAGWKQTDANTVELTKGKEKLLVKIICQEPFEIRDEMIEENAPAYHRIAVACKSRQKSIRMKFEYFVSPACYK